MKLRNIISRLFGKGDATESPCRPKELKRYSITLKEAFSAKYPSYMNILRMFEAANLCEATWENLTKLRLQKFVEYMLERVAPNSANQYATKLKAVLNLYSDEVSLPRDYAKVLTPKKNPTTAVYLKESELELLEQYQPANDNERFVRNMFLIAAYCGARHSDAIRLNESNIDGDLLKYVSKKTKTPTTVPLKPIVADYIRNTPKCEIADKTYNIIIRRICKSVGINQRVKVFKAGEERDGEKWEFVGSHTARRTCATLLYLRGVDIFTISKILGHSSVDVTTHYIQSGIRTDSEELMGYFK